MNFTTLILIFTLTIFAFTANNVLGDDINETCSISKSHENAVPDGQWRQFLPPPFHATDNEAFPPPYMISRVNLIDTCKKESKYYFTKYCPKCAACCQTVYYTICINGYRRRDRTAQYVDSPGLEKSPQCAAKCEPFHSFTIASIKCRNKIHSDCTSIFFSQPPSLPNEDMRLCCQLQYYRQYCLPAWNDKNLYILPERYQEIESPTCRVLKLPEYEFCSIWTKRSMDKSPYYSTEKNCTITPQSKASPNHL